MTATTFTGEAPGRVNLIGEHTDYNGGFVLPVAIPQRTRVTLSRRADDRVLARSSVVGTPDGESYVIGQECRRGTWIDYVQGITDVLRREGYSLFGFDADITSEVPIGSGLSSSAALEIALTRALRSAFLLDLPDVRMALLARRAENEFVGAPVGIMDQMACTFADEHTALFLDTRTLEYRRVPIPPGADLVVINSGVQHNHAAGDYRTRRAECEEAARELGVHELRDCGPGDLPRFSQLAPPLDRRAKHVVTENARVHEAVDAFDTGDLPRAGRLFAESHASMRDDFEVSVPEVDRLVELASEHPEVYGARLTGGGFGGSIVALVRKGSARDVARTIARKYQDSVGLAPTILVPLDTSPHARRTGPQGSDG